MAFLPGMIVVRAGFDRAVQREPEMVPGLQPLDVALALRVDRVACRARGVAGDARRHD
jgi:hypothetical protein